MSRPLDLICLGRAAVDLYGEQLGAPLEEMSSFNMSLGGCAANVAVGAARLGLKVAMLARVGDEHLGRFVRETLRAEGIDVSRVRTDPSRLTALVVLGIRDRHTFPLIFYRERCADMGLCEEDVEPELIAQARALLLTGTHFSEPGVDRASRRALALAREAGTKVVLDIDYRPVLWGLTGHGRGEDRYVRSERVSAHMLSIVEGCDLVVGTEEEMRIAGGREDTLAALSAIRARSAATLVLKRGAEGCVVFEGPIPPRVEDGFLARGLPIEVLNVLGAGDAFLGGFLRGWVRGEGLERSTELANAAGALVVSRHGCSPAMPTARELESYLSRAEHVRRIDLDPEIRRLHRVTTRPRLEGELAIFAFDHRSQLEAMADAAGASRSRLSELKRALAAVLDRVRAPAGINLGAIADERYGRQALELLAGRGLFLGRPIERPGSGLLSFEEGPDVGLALRTWPKGQVVKCLVRYHPADEPELRLAQEDRLRLLQEAAHHTGHELLLEVLPERPGLDTAAVVPALAALYEAGIQPDWWKIPPISDYLSLERLIHARDPDCRGVLLLGFEAGEAELAAAFQRAAAFDRVRGFAVGRSIFAAPARAWLLGQGDEEQLVSGAAQSFQRIIDAWAQARAGRTR